MAEVLSPDSSAAVAALLRDAAADGATVRISGANTKRGWGEHPFREPARELSTRRLDQLIRHDPGDLTAVVGAGMPLAALQKQLAPAGQMLALDPPFGEAATLGGIVATADSGPVSHRYGPARAQVLGVTVALSDGSVIRSGAEVIANVAGYDLPRLFCGSFGTLGVILSVSVRLRPVEELTATALGQAGDPRTVAAAVRTLTAAPLELRALDIAWRRGRGGLLAQVSGHNARYRAGRAAAVMQAAGLSGTDVVDDDSALWARQRAGQRSTTRALVRVSARPSRLAELLALSDACGATLVGRAALGVSYLELESERVAQLRGGLSADAHAEWLDRPAESSSHRTSGTWEIADAPTLALMRAIKARFDPAAICNRGVFVGGI